MTVTAAETLVQTLKGHGVDRIFCVPGESYIAVLDALYDVPEIEVITCRHESGAGFMAVADAKITNRAGTVFVSRGPGASNVSISIHTAQQDACPLVVFIGQIERKDTTRGAFQEVNYDTTFSGMAKWIYQVEDPDRLSEIAARAYRIAESGTPGPVIVVLPEDMLDENTDASPRYRKPRAHALPGEADLAAVAERLAAAERPVIIAGGQIHSAADRRALLTVSEIWHVPVAVGWKRQDLFPNLHPNFAGHLGYGVPKKLVDALGEADLVLAIGTRLGDITTQGFSFPKQPTPAQPLIHVYPDAEVIGKVFEAEQGVICDAGPFLEGLAARNAPPAAAARATWTERLHGVYSDLAHWDPKPVDDGVEFGHVVAALADNLEPDAVLITDGGNFSSWVHRYYPFQPSNIMIGAVAGAMGLAAPAAVAAALREPDRQVIAFIGDGGFLMTGNELATAVQYKAPVKLFISNNNSYATIRLHQERAHPGRNIATDLNNPDFAKLAEAFGATGFTIRTPEEAGPVVREALAVDGPAVVEVHSSLTQISAYVRMEQISRN